MYCIGYEVSFVKVKKLAVWSI